MRRRLMSTARKVILMEERRIRDQLHVENPGIRVAAKREEMTWQNNEEDDEISAINTHITTIPTPSISNTYPEDHTVVHTITCPSCGYNFQIYDHHQQGLAHDDLVSLPGGVKFDPTDKEILEHLEGKVERDGDDARKKKQLHPLIDQFIPTLEGEKGICCTHPERLPGVCKDGQIRHFFHRPSKAYTTGTRKRRKVQKSADGSETRWHKTGKTRPIIIGGVIKGFKKILVLYTNHGRQRKPEKTNWVMHQYHLGKNEEERDGELVVSKVFYKTQPRQSAGSTTGLKDLKDSKSIKRKRLHDNVNVARMSSNYADFYDQKCSASYDQLIPDFIFQSDTTSLDPIMAD